MRRTPDNDNDAPQRFKLMVEREVPLPPAAEAALTRAIRAAMPTLRAHLRRELRALLPHQGGEDGAA